MITGFLVCLAVVAGVLTIVMFFGWDFPRIKRWYRRWRSRQVL